jgi:hypothetical protein
MPAIGLVTSPFAADRGAGCFFLRTRTMPDDPLDRLTIRLAVHLHTCAVCRIDPGSRPQLGWTEQIAIHYVL